MTIICNCCKIEKDEIEFYKRKDCNGGYRKICKECTLKRDKIYNDKHKEERRKSAQENYLKNRDKNLLYKKEYYENNKETYATKSKEYYRKHQKELILYAKEYRKRHQKEITEKRKQKRHTDEKYYFEIYLRNKINNYLYRYGKIKKKNNVQEILGCNFQEFKVYIENQFEDGMSWDNRGEWHLDHITPLSTAKNYDELIKLNHYTNFQPLWAIDNIRKGNKIWKHTDEEQS